MVWVRLDDTFTDDPALDVAGPEAAWLHVAGLCYSNRNLTDGYLPEGLIRRLTSIRDPDAAAAQLVAVAVWELSAGGYRIVHHLDRQPSAEDVRRQRKLKSARQQRWRRSQTNGQYVDASTDGLRDASVDAAPTRPVKTGRPARTRARGTAVDNPRCSTGAVLAADGSCCEEHSSQEEAS